jgi:hypothetical protein
MIKAAIFVEGQTERIFAEHYVKEILGRSLAAVETRRAVGGANHKRRLTLLKGQSARAHHECFIMIVDCGCDNRVVSDIRDNYHSLCAAGFHMILGIRDVYPNFSYGEIPRLRSTLSSFLPSKPIAVEIILAVMELEAWFMGEHTHFARLNPALTLERIREKLGFDPSADDLERRAHPAADLNAIYKLAGVSYDKSRACVQRTVGNLDLKRMRAETAARFGDLRRFTTVLEECLPVKE